MPDSAVLTCVPSVHSEDLPAPVTAVAQVHLQDRAEHGGAGAGLLLHSNHSGIMPVRLLLSYC